MEELIYSHAVGIDSDNDALRQWSALQGHRSRLAGLRFDLRLKTGEARKDLRRKIRTELTAKRRTVKGSQLDRLLSGNFERGKETLEMQLPDGPSDDRHAWAKASAIHGKEVYRDDENDYSTQLQRLIRVQRLAQREMSRGWLPPAVKFHDFLKAMAGAKANKQPGSDWGCCEDDPYSQLAETSLDICAVSGKIGWQKERDRKPGVRLRLLPSQRRLTRWASVRCATSACFQSCRSFMFVHYRRQSEENADLMSATYWDLSVGDPRLE